MSSASSACSDMRCILCTDASLTLRHAMHPVRRCMALTLASGIVKRTLADIGGGGIVELPDCTSTASQLLLHVLHAGIACHHAVVNYMQRFHHALTQEASAPKA
eukprot:5309757-Pleurochrysis_carterae.AAC.1